MPLLFAFSLSANPGYFEPWGNDADLRFHPKEQETPKLSIPSKLANAVIQFHQNVISPVDGPRSHFRPTSSRYMQLAMQRYGFLKGYIMGCDRLLREDDEEWIYPVVEIEGRRFKYDPAKINKND